MQYRRSSLFQWQVLKMLLHHLVANLVIMTGLPPFELGADQVRLAMPDTVNNTLLANFLGAVVIDTALIEIVRVAIAQSKYFY